MNRTSTAATLAAALALLSSCAPAPEAPAGPRDGARPSSTRVVATFTGELDAAAGTLTLRPEAPQQSSALSVVPVVQDGTPGTNPPDTVELVTEAAQERGLGCGALDSFDGDVRLRSFFASKQLRNVHVELVAIGGTGHEACNSAPEVPGASARYGLWSYGQLAPAGSVPDASAVARWSFRLPDRTAFTFRGRVLADVVAPTCDLAFPNPPAVPVQAGAYAIVAADLGGDGVPDLVVANSTNASVSVAKGAGRGRFEPSVRLAAPGLTPYAVAVADVNGDARPDILLADDGGRLGRFLQAADGTFGVYAYWSSGSGARALAVADLDGDGDADVAVANSSASTLGLFANDGAGGFGTVIPISLVGANPYAVAAGDVDGDGVRDLVVASPGTSSVLVLHNAGWGSPLSAASFAPAVSYPNGSPAQAAQALALGDLDADGDLDLAVLSTSSSNVTVLLNDGAGAFSPGERHAPAAGLRALAAGDVTGDGVADVVVVSSTLDEAFLLRGVGGASFAPATALEVGDGPYGVAIADLTGDGAAELLTANNLGGDASVLLGRAGGPRSFDAYALPVAKDVVAADLDGDGDLDFAASENAGVRPFLGTGAFALAPQSVLTAGSAPDALAAGDLDGDADVDLVVANLTSHDLSVFLNLGGASFSAGARYPTGVGTGATLTSSPRGVAIVDVNLDGRPDLVAANNLTSTVSITRNLGGGTFSTTPTLITGCTSPSGLAAGDVDRDGRVDVVATCNTSPAVLAVFRNTGVGLAAPATYAVVGSPKRPALGDLDGDGWLDVVVPGAAASTASVLRNLGNGTFAAAATVTAFAGTAQPASVSIADLDRDGIPDLVFGTTGRYDVSVVRGTGGMTFAAPVPQATRGSALAAVPVDLDGDTRLDLVAACNGGALVVLPGACLP